MPDSTGFGDYTESGQVIPVSFQGRKGGYTHCMFLNNHPPIAAGRELWGFPKKLAEPTLKAEIDTLVGTLHYGPLRIAIGTMGYKHKQADVAAVKASLLAPNFLLKIIPHVDGKARICELVEYHLEDVDVKGAWTGPAQLTVFSHALAPLAELPVLEVVSGAHVIADLTLRLGQPTPRGETRRAIWSACCPPSWQLSDIQAAPFEASFLCGPDQTKREAKGGYALAAY
jgi:acetoacetate decarboxylase